MTGPPDPFLISAGGSRFGRGVELLSIRTLRDEMAMSGQSQLVASGQMLLAAPIHRS